MHRMNLLLLLLGLASIIIVYTLYCELAYIVKQVTKTGTHPFFSSTRLPFCPRLMTFQR